MVASNASLRGRQLEWNCELGVEKGELAPSALQALTLLLSPRFSLVQCVLDVLREGFEVAGHSACLL